VLVAEPIGDETYARGIAQARSALGGRTRLRPRPLAAPGPTAEAAEPRVVDDRDARIAELEAEVAALKAQIARARRALDPNR
jgi:hypothetical protein